MMTGIIICLVYVAILFGLTKIFGIKYADIAKSTNNLLKGLLIPVGTSTILLAIYGYWAGWIPRVFTTSQIDVPWLWIIPVLLLVLIFSQFTKANWKAFDRRGIVYMLLGVAVVGISEELLTRGILVASLQDAGYSTLIIALVSSLVFGVLHGMNFLNGQDAKTTIIQVVATFLTGLNFFILYKLTGTLWVPIVLHSLFDLSLLCQGGELNHRKAEPTKLDLLLTLSLYALPLVALFFL